jgi:glycosyltransferase involved in cell wall biosynthesis
LNDLPSLTIIIVAKNAYNYLKESLRYIDSQEYPKKLIEVLIIDGGSTDNTYELVESYGYKFIDGGYSENQEARRYVALGHAKNDIIVWLDSDNYIIDKYWLNDMVSPFIEYDNIDCTYTKWYSYTENMSALNKYYALIGGGDPIAYYLNKNDRLPLFNDSLPYYINQIKDRGSYHIVSFTNENDLPALGCNGFLIRRSVLNLIKYENPNEYFHTDVLVDIMQKKNLIMGIVKNSIVHNTGDTIRHSIFKRISYMKLHSQELSQLRKYKVFSFAKKKDIFKGFIIFIRISTLIEPLVVSIIKSIKYRNVYWMLHPFMSFITMFSYLVGLLKKDIK